MESEKRSPNLGYYGGFGDDIHNDGDGQDGCCDRFPHDADLDPESSDMKSDDGHRVDSGRGGRANEISQTEEEQDFNVKPSIGSSSENQVLFLDSDSGPGSIPTEVEAEDGDGDGDGVGDGSTTVVPETEMLSSTTSNEDENNSHTTHDDMMTTTVMKQQLQSLNQSTAVTAGDGLTTDGTTETESSGIQEMDHLQHRHQLEDKNDDTATKTRATTVRMVVDHDFVEVEEGNTSEQEEESVDVHDRITGGPGQSWTKNQEQHKVKGEAGEHDDGHSSNSNPTTEQLKKAGRTEKEEEAQTGATSAHKSPSSLSSTSNNTERTTTATTRVDKMIILSLLPIDSLHTIASFLTPKEWSSLSKCNKSTNKVCRDVFRRVRLHGFKCATEVVTAWKLGQHADAKELCALYIQSGVPIYPWSLGHSYHTLLWRMHAEVKHVEEMASSAREDITPELRTNDDSNVVRGRVHMDSDEATRAGTGEEVRVGNNEDSSGSTSGDSHNRNETTVGERIDPFYTNRDDARRTRLFIEEFGLLPTRGNTLPFSYLEEKAIFMIQANDEKQPEIDRLTRNLRRQMSLNPLTRNANGQLLERRQPANENNATQITVGRRPNDVTRADTLVSASPNSNSFSGPRLTRSNSFSEHTGYRPPKVLMKVHRHLLDQHLLGRSSVFDSNGEMNTPMFSLSADFFHPFFSYRQRRHQNRHLAVLSNSGNDALSADGLVSGHLVPVWNSVSNDTSRSYFGDRVEHFDDELNMSPESLFDRAGHYLARRVALYRDESDDSDDEDEEEATLDSALDSFTLDPRNNAGNDHDNAPTALQNMGPPPPLSAPGALGTVSSSYTAARSESNYCYDDNEYRRNWLENIDLEVYSASSSTPGGEDPDDVIQQLKKHLKIRFAAYLRRLEKHLSNRHSDGFEECILDFWDEFLPQTANIHYYDRHTAVPRLSSLHKFLTKPCPKAVGIVQCEIERIKVCSKKKGVNVKGRFFPTYEYRLFIRHRHADHLRENPPDDEQEGPRRDTVLMMAKNRGRKHVENSGHSLSAFTSKKGSNNYYLHLPKQEDIDAHFKSVNGLDSESKPTVNGAGIGYYPDSNPPLLGRLQSNFIGTEFQIYTPKISKQGPKPKPFCPTSRSISGPLIISGTLSDDDILNDNESAADPAAIFSGGRLRRFGRLSLIGRGGSQNNNNRCVSQDDSLGHTDGTSSTGIALRRSQSSGDMVPTRKNRISRRVSAADAPESQNRLHSDLQSHTTTTEEEDGAITYTANLLGSRPRIMDVCIPRVTPDGTGSDWRRYLEHCNDPEVTSSMNKMLNHLKILQQRSDVEETDRENHANLIGGDRTDVAGGSRGRTRSLSFHADPETCDAYTPPDDFGLLALQNRPPWWNVELGSFVLNFGGRVSVASVKNFQLCDRYDQDYIMLQFGRIAGRHSFTMDFQYPLTAVQAFAIAISSLQSKISFG